MMFDPTKGRIVPNVTSVTLVNNVTKTIDTTVPAGKRWSLKFITVTNPDNVVRNVDIYLYKEAAKTNVLAYLFTKVGMEAAAAKRYQIPSSIPTGVQTTELNPPFPILLDSGMTIEVIWTTGGASAGGTDTDGLVVYVREFDL